MVNVKVTDDVEIIRIVVQCDSKHIGIWLLLIYVYKGLLLVMVI